VTQLLITGITIGALIAVPLVTFSIGLETGGPQLRSLLGNRGLTLRYFLATFVVMPAIAVGVGMLGLPWALWVGLGLMSIAPPAPPATNRLRKMGNRDVGLAWQAVAFLIAIVTIPLTVAIVQHMGIASDRLNLTWGTVLKRSVLFFAAPMLAGLLTRRYWPRGADSLEKPVGLAANVAFGIVVLLVLIVAVPVIGQFGIASVAAVVAFVALAVVIGHLLGGPGNDTRITLAAMLAARFPLPALVLAQANGQTKQILPIVLVYVFAGVLLVPIYARLFGHSGKPSPVSG
jgi:BASS family bile acid:Na+ symporter